MINPEKKHKKFIKISVEAFICRFVNMHIDTHTKTFLMHILDLVNKKYTRQSVEETCLKNRGFIFEKFYNFMLLFLYFTFSSSS
jgi:hypothetical protein